jgi:membrane-associated protease RseP (regulator of RpoE activity)
MGLFLFVTAGSQAQDPATQQALQFDPATQQALQFLGHAQAPDNVVNVALDRMVLAKFKDSLDEMLGATLEPVGETLRTQLAIPAGQGLLITGLRDDGPSAQAGLKQNDVLLLLADKPLAAAADVTKALKAVGEAASPLKILRQGKPLTIQVRPVYRVTLGPVHEQKAEYFIGVAIDPVNDAVRAQLSIPKGEGVVVNDVVTASPAEKAGVKKHDILLKLAGKPIASPEALAHEVQTVQDRPAVLILLRASKRLEVPIVGAVRKVEAPPTPDRVTLWMLDREGNDAASRLAAWEALAVKPDARFPSVYTAGTGDVRQRLERLENELKSVRETLDKINKALTGDKGAKRD